MFLTFLAHEQIRDGPTTARQLDDASEPVFDFRSGGLFEGSTVSKR
jgi:hypothetical protein